MAVSLRGRRLPAFRLFSCWPYSLLLVFLHLDIARASGCYYADNSTVLSSPDYVVPCGDITSTTSPFLNCCALQSNNVCLSSSLCYDPNQVGGAYYLSPCTDQTYSAPECPQYCSMLYFPTVTLGQPINDEKYTSPNDCDNEKNRIWRCCSTNKDGSSNCSYPTDETFSAPPPNELSTIYPTLHATSSSSLASLAPSSSVSSSSYLSASSPHSSELKTSTGSTTQRISSTLDSTPTKPTATPTNDGAGGGGLHASDKVALGIGVPGTIATIAGAYFAYAALKKRSQMQMQRQPATNQSRPNGG